MGVEVAHVLRHRSDARLILATAPPGSTSALSDVPYNADYLPRPVI